MATLQSLKEVLNQKATEAGPNPRQSLSDTQYSAGFDLLIQGPGGIVYEEFIIPQLFKLLAPLFNSRGRIAVLEIGPGPRSILGYLPPHMRWKVRRYTAFEPNGLFAQRLEEWLRRDSEIESVLPALEHPPDIRPSPFVPGHGTRISSGTGRSNNIEKYDVILFCHSMYGMKPQHKFIYRALEMLTERPQSGMVVIFHRSGVLKLDGLVCYRTACFPTGVVRIADKDETLDCFASFIAGFSMQGVATDKTIRVEWRTVCRALGRREKAYPGYLSFSAPEVMVAFTKHATALPELTAQMPSVMRETTVKNREARTFRPASIVQPTQVQHIQKCIQWALKHGAGLTVVGGGHSGHCLWPNVVSIDMCAFNQVHIVVEGQSEKDSTSNAASLVVAEAGSKTEDIIRKTLAAGMTVPLGSRPSVGAGLWLQGGIGHLARLYGLACDAIVGAVVVSVASGEVLCIGCVPNEHQPAGAVRPETEPDLLWAIKGAGTNFGIVVSVVFKAYTAPTYLTRNWIVPLSNSLEARLKLSDFSTQLARALPQNCSADAYLYRDADQLHLGVTLFESFTTDVTSTSSVPTLVDSILGPEDDRKAVDGIGLFNSDMYVSGMHGGHGGGKTSSFKRCLFFKNVGYGTVADQLVAAIESPPGPLCYLHLLQGGGAISEIAAEGTAFGCRDWDFACVITGVWARDQDGTDTAQSVVEWVYKVARNLLSLSSGVYGADLGPDPRDATLAAKAFGPNTLRLASLKRILDPSNVLSYACPLPQGLLEQKLVILVTGESCAGKDYCAEIWVSVLMNRTHPAARVRAVSISEATKREYAAATGADPDRLLSDRAYKEQHRPALTAFFQEQAQQRPKLPEDHFLSLVHGAEDTDVLLITGMRDEAPVATFSHLAPDRKILEVHVHASERTRLVRQGMHCDEVDGADNKSNIHSRPKLKLLDHHPSFTFDNNATGDEAAKRFAERYLVPFLHEDLQRLANMVRVVPDFPRPGIEFRHVLGISQQPGGLNLCTSLLQTHFFGDWAKVGAVVCCETGGLVYASALASRVELPLVLVREAGKLPPPTLSVAKSPSHISSMASKSGIEKRVEMERDVIPRGALVVVVDDVLSTGETLCAVLRLLVEACVSPENISFIAVAEFPFHRGRELLRQRGFGRINLQSLLVFDGA